MGTEITATTQSRIYGNATEDDGREERATRKSLEGLDLTPDWGTQGPDRERNRLGKLSTGDIEE